MTRESALDDMRMHVKLKLSLLWTALMFLYIYGDYFGLYVPGQLKGMLDGQGPIGPVSQGSLAVVSILTVLPGLMVFLSIVLPPRVSRWLNFAMGLLYTFIAYIPRISGGISGQFPRGRLNRLTAAAGGQPPRRSRARFQSPRSARAS